MSFIITRNENEVGIITLNRPEMMNAWHSAMRRELIEVFQSFEADSSIRAIILTGAGDRAFSAGQDLNEARSFSGDQGREWVGEWERLYDAMRSLSKPLIAALNGVAAGSAFQVALLCDFRIGHPGVRMGQPEINAGIASTTGPWIMREILGLARTIDLTLSGRLMEAEECKHIGIINRVVPAEEVMSSALELARFLGGKPPVAMRLNKMRFKEMTDAGLQDALEAGRRVQKESYASGEPARMMKEFLEARAQRKAS